MKIAGLSIQGFRSFKSDEVIKFPVKPGFVYLTGRNEEHPELGANGSGKSSFLEAIVWVFFGKTSRGLKGSSVANWAREHLCSVTCDFYLDPGRDPSQTLHNLTRTWDPITLTLQVGKGDPTPITQEELEALIGFNFHSFMNVVMMGQFGSYFFDLTPTEKLTLFSNLFELNYWLERSSVASKAADEFAQEADRLKTEIAKKTGSIRTHHESVADLTKQADTFGINRQHALLTLQGSLRDAEDKFSLAGKTERGIKGESLTAADALDTATKAVLSIDDRLKTFTTATHDALSVYKNAASAVKTIAEEIRRVEELREGDCPHCYNLVSGEHLAMVLERLRANLASRRAEADAARAAHEGAKIKSERIEAQKRTADVAYSTAKNNSDDVLRRLNEAARLTARAFDECEKQRNLIAQEKAKENPYLTLIESTKAKIKALEDDKSVLEADAAKALRREDRRRFWVQHFKDLRLWLIDRALADFEIAVNNSLADLGLGGWSITMDVERANSTGGISKGFSVFIKSPDHDEPVPWEAWCGGETQRLRIAGAIGLAELIRSRAGLAAAVEFWDEPTAHLSREGISDLLKFFKTRARTLKRQVWLVDHRSLSAGEFDASFTVVRDAQGSHFSLVEGDGGE